MGEIPVSQILPERVAPNSDVQTATLDPVRGRRLAADIATSYPLSGVTVSFVRARAGILSADKAC